jgi:hypothetical protein
MRPSTLTQPAAIQSSASRREASPRSVISLEMRTPRPAAACGAGRAGGRSGAAGAGFAAAGRAWSAASPGVGARRVSGRESAARGRHASRAERRGASPGGCRRRASGFGAVRPVALLRAGRRRSRRALRRRRIGRFRRRLEGAAAHGAAVGVARRGVGAAC